MRIPFVVSMLPAGVPARIARSGAIRLHRKVEGQLSGRRAFVPQDVFAIPGVSPACRPGTPHVSCETNAVSAGAWHDPAPGKWLQESSLASRCHGLRAGVDAELVED